MIGVRAVFTAAMEIRINTLPMVRDIDTKYLKIKHSAKTIIKDKGKKYILRRNQHDFTEEISKMM